MFFVSLLYFWSLLLGLRLKIRTDSSRGKSLMVTFILLVLNNRYLYFLLSSTAFKTVSLGGVSESEPLCFCKGIVLSFLCFFFATLFAFWIRKKKYCVISPEKLRIWVSLFCWFECGKWLQGILINGQFPGPHIDAVTNDNLIISVYNYLRQPFLISWYSTLLVLLHHCYSVSVSLWIWVVSNSKRKRL